MSRGPGRMMRAALAELAIDGYTSATGVVLRARHDQDCECGDVDNCIIDVGRARRFWYQQFSPERADLVSARRALRTLAERGKVRLVYVAADDGGRVLYAHSFCDSPEAALRLPVRPGGALPTHRQFLRALEAARKRCLSRMSDSNTYAQDGAS